MTWAKLLLFTPAGANDFRRKYSELYFVVPPNSSFVGSCTEIKKPAGNLLASTFPLLFGLTALDEVENLCHVLGASLETKIGV